MEIVGEFVFGTQLQWTCLYFGFGSIDELPEETTHLNHPEISIHFGQLEEVAKKLVFKHD